MSRRKRGAPAVVVAYRTSRASDRDCLIRFVQALENRDVVVDAEYCRSHARVLRRFLENDYPTVGHRLKQGSRDKYISDARFGLVEGLGHKADSADLQIARILKPRGLMLSPLSVGKIARTHRDESAAWLESEIEANHKGERSKQVFRRLVARALRAAIEAERQAALDARPGPRKKTRRKG